MNDIAVAKITIEAPATSFRYPHFLIGRQLSFEMPPPSTIYGHIASALGDWPERGSIQFAYDFRFAAKCSDLEHQHIITAGGRAFVDDGRKWPVSVQATVQPHLRDFLFRPRLTLYVSPASLAAAFRSPTFCVILGRSQDLASITMVEETVLERAKGAYLEHTLLPFEWRPYMPRGVTVLMPRFISPPPERRAEFDRYIVLHDRVFTGEIDGGVASSRRAIIEPGSQELFVDTSTPLDHGVHRGVVLQSYS